MFMSRKDIETLSRRVISAYSRLPENIVKPLLKVEPEKLARNLLKLKLDFCKLSVDGTVLGLTSFDPNEFRINEQDVYVKLKVDHPERK